MSVKPALALKAAEVVQDPEDQGVAVEEVGAAAADRDKVEEVGAEAVAVGAAADDAFR